MVIQNYDYEVQTSYTWYLFFIFLIFFILCYWFDQKNGLHCFTLFSIRIKFGLAQISVPKIGIPMSKIACINPCPHIDQFISAGDFDFGNQHQTTHKNSSINIINKINLMHQIPIVKNFNISIFIHYLFILK